MKRFMWMAAAAFGACAAYGQAEYPGALWNPAHLGNQTASNRPTTYPINYIVIHVMQGSYAGSISWFQNDASNVSAHYCIRSSDGQITQMVLHKNIGWHAGNWNYNTWSVGIEHEGFVDNPAWFTNAMYKSSADLSRWILNRHSIPKDRTRVIGHVEVPGATHTDPGPNWNWDYYMELIRHAASYLDSTIPIQMQAGSTMDVVVRMTNSGEDGWLNSGAAVTLNTQNPPGRSSPFYSTGNWISPSSASAVDAPTPGGSIGEFTFRLNAPTTPGVYSESFQLSKSTIGYFGPVATFQIEVTPDGDVYDNDGGRATFKGSWSTGTTAPGHYGADYRFAGTDPVESAVATWYLKGTPNQAYDVYAWWSQGTNRSNEAKYRLIDGLRQAGASRTVLVNQQANGGQWNYLGKVTMGYGGAQVQLTNLAPAGKVVIADAIRIVPRGR